MIKWSIYREYCYNYKHIFAHIQTHKIHEATTYIIEGINIQFNNNSWRYQYLSFGRKTRQKFKMAIE